MANITITEIMKKTADPTIIGDVDKMILTVVYEGVQYRIAQAWSDFTTADEFKTILTSLIPNLKPSSTVTNMSNTWAGDYTGV